MILVSGANGFIGQGLMKLLALRGVPARALVRDRTWGAGSDVCHFSGLDDLHALRGAMRGVDTVIHLAGRAHVLRETSTQPQDVFEAVNCQGTLNVAEAARGCGVKRFVFLSSTTVLGTETHGQPLQWDAPPQPRSPAAVSKSRAEAGLMEMASQGGMEWVIVRAPLVYGPGVKGNMALLLKALWRGLPLPFATVRNRRSMIGLENLADLLLLCATHPAAANRQFLASDGVDLSTPDLLRALGRALGKPARLMPLPPTFLSLLGRIAGKGDAIRNLCGSLELDISATRDLLGWNPPREPAEEIQAMADAFRSAQSRLVGRGASGSAKNRFSESQE